MSTHENGSELVQMLRSGQLDRRGFLRWASVAGLSASAIAAGLAWSPRGADGQDAPAPEPSAPRPDGTAAPDDQQILRMVTPSPFRMDPPTYGGDLWQLQLMVYQCLTRVETDGSIAPGVADSWSSNPEATVWTFTLNPNARFSDGSPLTADDVKWTWDYIVNPASKSVGPDVPASKIAGYQEVRDGAATEMTGVVVKDPQTIEFTLTTPVPYFPALAGHLTTCTLKGDNVTSGGEEWWRTPVTSGFFKVTEFTPGDQATMTLERNENWYREPAKLSQITMQLVADPQTQLVMYDNDEIDGMVCQPAEFAQATKPDGERSTDLYWEPADATWYFGFAIFKPPFEDVKVRQAFASAVDLQAVSIAALNGIYPPQPRILRPGFPCGGDEQWQPAFDVEGAKALLAESTYGGVEGLPPITIIISEQGGATALGTWGRVATVIQQQLQQNLGVEVQLVRQIFNSVAEQVDFINATEGGAIFRLSFGASVQDPAYVSNVGRTGSSANITGYSNPALDELIAQADAELDEAARCALYTQIDQTLSQEAIFLAPFRGTSTWFFKPKVRGMKVAQGRIWNSVHKMYIAAE
jgi:ABC-type transport system substrate-binding protein